MGFVGPILIKLWTSFIWGFLWLPEWWPLGSCLCKHAGDHSVTNEACSSPHLTSLRVCMAAWKLNGAICAMDNTKCPWTKPVWYFADLKVNVGERLKPRLWSICFCLFKIRRIYDRLISTMGYLMFDGISILNQPQKVFSANRDKHNIYSMAN